MNKRVKITDTWEQDQWTKLLQGLSDTGMERSLNGGVELEEGAVSSLENQEGPS